MFQPNVDRLVSQEIVKAFEYVLKLFVVLMVPLISLALLTSDKVTAPIARRRILLAGAVVQALLLIGLLWWSFHVQSVTGLGSIFEIVLALVGIGCTLALKAVKKKDDE